MLKTVGNAHMNYQYEDEFPSLPRLIFTRIFGLWALRGQGGRAKGENFSQQSEIS